MLPPSPVEEEQRPLLDPNHPEEGHGTIARESRDGGEGGEYGEDGEADVPIAEEPTTWKLITIIGAVWIGSFFAALGTLEITLRMRPEGTCSCLE